MPSSIFANDGQLRSQYSEKSGTDLQAAISPATAVRLAKLNQWAKAMYIDNGLNVELVLLIVKPSPDVLNTNRKVEFMRLAASRVLNLELASVNLQIDAGAEIWVYCASAPTNSASIKARLFTWG